MQDHARQREDAAKTLATVAFIDIAGFSAIADVYGDAAALDVLEVFSDEMDRRRGNALVS